MGKMLERNRGRKRATPEHKRPHKPVAKRQAEGGHSHRRDGCSRRRIPHLCVHAEDTGRAGGRHRGKQNAHGKPEHRHRCH